jgi:UDP-glucose 4-epimerase
MLFSMGGGEWAIHSRGALCYTFLSIRKRVEAMAILVTGGCGYIGSHTAAVLTEAGREVVIVDSLVNSKALVVDRIEALTGRRPAFYKADVRNEQALAEVFETHPIEGVIHFAGLKAVGESVAQPLAYYSANIEGAAALLRVMQRQGVRRLVFSSSATVYGDTDIIPYTEDLPLQPMNPYGRTKAAVEWMLTDLYHSQPGWSISILRYFNPVGAHPSGLIGEDPAGIPNNLMPYITQVAVGRRPELGVFGGDYPTPDGSCVRDYIHVMDLAEGHLAALGLIEGSHGLFVHNLGSGRGVSVLEMVKAFSEATGQAVPYSIKPRRAGDLPAYWADASKALRDMNWRTHRSLADICRDAYEFQRQNPKGYVETT